MSGEQKHESRPLVYLTVKNEATAEYEVKRSRFIGYVKPVLTVDEAEEFIREIRANIMPPGTMSTPIYSRAAPQNIRTTGSRRAAPGCRCSNA